ncbi:MAG TPA: hypothetical protein VGE76_24455, partial [Opitutaceae bacterium]
MNLRITFGQKIASGFAAVVALAVIGAVVGVRAVSNVVLAKDRVLAENAASLISAAKFQAGIEYKVAAARGFLLTAKDSYLQRLAEAHADAERISRELRQQAGGEAAALLGRIAQAEAEYAQIVARAISQRQGGANVDEVARFFDDAITPKRIALDKLVDEFVAQA